MSATLTQCWTFNQPTPIGNVRTSWQLTSDGLDVRSVPSIGTDEILHWDTMAEAATAVLELPAGKGGPDIAHSMIGRMEWLLISRSDGRRPFMRPLPGSDARDAIVAALRERLGSRWAGERLPLQSAQKQLGISTRGDGLKYVAMIASILALLLLVVVLAAIVAGVLYLPAIFALGAWLFRKGLLGLRDALQAANTPTARASSAAMGLVELEGRALTEQPSPAAVTGRQSVWWDVGVEAWYRGRRGKGGRWRQVMARHGGNGGLVLEDATGRVPVWLRDADCCCKSTPGRPARTRCRRAASRCSTAAGSPGTVAAGCAYTSAGWKPAGRYTSLARSTRRATCPSPATSGAWRGWSARCERESGVQAVVRATPELLRGQVMVVIGYLGLLSSVGRAGGRTRGLQDASPPTLAPDALLVWKGRAGRTFIVSDQRETGALGHLRKRSLWLVAGGVAVLCFGLYEVIQVLADGGSS